MPSIRRHNPTYAPVSKTTPKVNGQKVAASGCQERQSVVKGRIRRFLIDFPKISKTKFGTMAVNNANFMNGLDHKDVWMKDVTMDKVEAFIDNWIATHGS